MLPDGLKLIRSGWFMRCVAIWLGLLVVSAAPARAQVFVELGGGWNFVEPLDAPGSFHRSGSSIQASIGQQVASHFGWRVDLSTSQFEVEQGPLPCPSTGCSPSAYLQPERVSGLTANGVLSVDPRGILYVLGGAGYYQVNVIDFPMTEFHFGLSAGAGVAVPIAGHLRVFAEARWLGLFGYTAGPSQLVPVVVGLRF